MDFTSIKATSDHLSGLDIHPVSNIAMDLPQQLMEGVVDSVQGLMDEVDPTFHENDLLRELSNAFKNSFTIVQNTQGYHAEQSFLSPLFIAIQSLETWKHGEEGTASPSLENISDDYSLLSLQSLDARQGELFADILSTFRRNLPQLFSNRTDNLQEGLLDALRNGVERTLEEINLNPEIIFNIIVNPLFFRYNWSSESFGIGTIVGNFIDLIRIDLEMTSALLSYLSDFELTSESSQLIGDIEASLSSSQSCIQQLNECYTQKIHPAIMGFSLGELSSGIRNSIRNTLKIVSNTSDLAISHLEQIIEKELQHLEQYMFAESKILL